MKIISSSLTFTYKYIFCGLWFFMGGASNLILIYDSIFYSKHTDALLYFWLMAWAVCSTILYFTFAKIKSVHLIEKKLIISNYKRRIEVDLSEIESIGEYRYWNPELISIKFKKPNEFGEKIIFIPSIRFLKGKKHPAIGLLKEKAKNAL